MGTGPSDRRHIVVAVTTPAGKTQPRSIRLSNEELRDLARIAERHERSVAAQMRWLLREGIHRELKKIAA